MPISCVQGFLFSMSLTTLMIIFLKIIYLFIQGQLQREASHSYFDQDHIAFSNRHFDYISSTNPQTWKGFLCFGVNFFNFFSCQLTLNFTIITALQKLCNLIQTHCFRIFLGYFRSYPTKHQQQELSLCVLFQSFYTFRFYTFYLIHFDVLST